MSQIIIGTFLVGLPGVGKSTFIKNLQEKYPDSIDIISTDNYNQGKCDEAGITYSEGFKSFIKEAEADMWKRLTNPQRNFVIDRTNLTVACRAKIMNFVRSNRRNFTSDPVDLIFSAIIFKTPDTETWKRNLDSRPGKVIPQNVLDSMAKSYQEPSYFEGFDFVMTR